MLSKQEGLRQSVIVGWFVLLQLVLIMFIVSILQGAIANDFTGFSKDPGELGVNIMIIVFTIYAVLPIMVRTLDMRIFRWFVVAISIFFFLFFIAHQITHMIVDNTPLNLYHTLDFAHHAVMLMVIVLAIRWARAHD